MEEERDVVVFSDDEGNEFELEIVDYFDYEEQEYAVLIDPETAGDEAEQDTEVYIMKIVENGEYEEFLPADEDKMDALTEIVEKRFEEWDEDDECECDDECCCGGDCDCDDEKCDCGCEHEAHEHCGCGCEDK